MYEKWTKKQWLKFIKHEDKREECHESVNNIKQDWIQEKKINREIEEKNRNRNSKEMSKRGIGRTKNNDAIIHGNMRKESL